MPRLSRREFLRSGTGVAAGAASWLSLGKAPAFAQKRQLSFLSFNSFVPASDEELRRQAEAFGKQAGIEVQVDTISSSQLPAKLAAEAQSSSAPPPPIHSSTSSSWSTSATSSTSWASSTEAGMASPRSPARQARAGGPSPGTGTRSRPITT